MANDTHTFLGADLADVAAERLRRLETRDRIDRQARERIASAIGMEPVPRSWDILCGEVERRIAEDAATIERLHLAVVAAATAMQTDEVPLPEYPEVRNA